MNKKQLRKLIKLVKRIGDDNQRAYALLQLREQLRKTPQDHKNWRRALKAVNQALDAERVLGPRGPRVVNVSVEPVPPPQGVQDG